MSRDSKIPKSDDYLNRVGVDGVCTYMYPETYCYRVPSLYSKRTALASGTYEYNVSVNASGNAGLVIKPYSNDLFFELYNADDFNLLTGN